MPPERYSADTFQKQEKERLTTPIARARSSETDLSDRMRDTATNEGKSPTSIQHAFRQVIIESQSGIAVAIQPYCTADHSAIRLVTVMMLAPPQLSDSRHRHQRHSREELDKTERCYQRPAPTSQQTFVCLQEKSPNCFSENTRIKARISHLMFSDFLPACRSIIQQTLGRQRLSGGERSDKSPRPA